KRNAFGGEEGCQGGGRDIVEATFDVEEERGNFGVGSLVGPDFMNEGSGCVKGTKTSKRAALVGVEEANCPGQDGEARGNYALEYLRHSFKEDDNAKGCRGGVVNFAGFRENNAVSP